jgi:hypothetical protein
MFIYIMSLRPRPHEMAILFSNRFGAECEVLHDSCVSIGK